MCVCIKYERFSEYQGEFIVDEMIVDNNLLEQTLRVLLLIGYHILSVLELSKGV